MLRLLLLSLTLPTLLTVSPGAFAAEKVLKPASQWNADWGEKTCTLLRAFGTEKDPFILRFEQFQPGPSFQLVMAGKPLWTVRQQSQFAITYGNGQRKDMTGRFLPGTSNSTMPTIFLPTSTLVADIESTKDVNESQYVTPEIEAAVTSITLNFSGKVLRLETGSLGKPFAALRLCTDNLVKHWGLDPKEQATLQRFPLPLTAPGDWIRSSDYPANALMAGKQAIVYFRLNVDHTGVPTACEIQRAYSEPEFEKKTCKALMSRARFDPALDAAAKPIASYFISSVHWIMQ